MKHSHNDVNNAKSSANSKSKAAGSTEVKMPEAELTSDSNTDQSNLRSNIDGSEREERIADKVVEIGGPKGPEPTRYGDWEKNGRCYDF